MQLKFAESPYKDLLKDPAFKRWLQDVERGSVTTASAYLRTIGHLCAEFKITPPILAKMGVKKATEFLFDTVTHFEDKQSAGTNIKGYVRALKSWWSYNGTEVVKKVKISGGSDYGKYENEIPPKSDQLARIFDVADMRAKVACSIMAFSGCRPGVLGNFLGNDGLKIADFSELGLHKNTVKFSAMPTIIWVRKSLSKARHKYISWLPEQGCNYLKTYLEFRLRNGEKLTGDSPIFTALSNNPREVGSHIRTTNIGDLIRKPIRAAGFDWRPYIFRRYFDTRLMQAEVDGLLIRDWRVFWMGHKGDIEHTYTLNKGLSEDVIEQMREKYSAVADKFLVTVKKPTLGADEILARMNRQFLTLADYSEQQLQEIGDLSKLSQEQMLELIRKKSAGLMCNGRQKIVPRNEARELVNQGWHIASSFSQDEFVVELPMG